jgi:hypothetical protein
MSLMKNYSSVRIGAEKALKHGFKPNDVQKAAQKMWSKKLGPRGKVTPKSDISHRPSEAAIIKMAAPEREMRTLIKLAQQRFKTKNPTDEQIESIWRGLGKKNYFDW